MKKLVSIGVLCILSASLSQTTLYAGRWSSSYRAKKYKKEKENNRIATQMDVQSVTVQESTPEVLPVSPAVLPTEQPTVVDEVPDTMPVGEPGAPVVSKTNSLPDKTQADALERANALQERAPDRGQEPARDSETEDDQQEDEDAFESEDESGYDASYDEEYDTLVGDEDYDEDNAPIEQPTAPDVTDYQVRSSLGDHDFNIEAKKHAAQSLVKRGAEYLKSHSVAESFSAFTHDKYFTIGELYLFAFDSKGVCLAHGNQADLIWDDMLNSKDTYGVPFVQLIIEKGRAGGDWVTYQWDNATIVAYVTEVRKEGKSYFIGAGYYPHSKVDAVVNLVKGAVAYFNAFIKEGKSTSDAFSSFSYTLGKFVFGDLYLYAVSFKGIQYAHGETPGFVGNDVWNYRDANGKLVNQEIIAALKDVDYGTGIWIEYISKNASKRTYAEKVIDGAGNQYFIACGFYPDANRTEAQNLVKRGYRYMKANGKTEAARMFTDPNEKEFRYGDLYLFVNTLKGVSVANGGNPAVVGTNQFEERDEDGEYFMQAMIKRAMDGGGWVDYKSKNSFRSVYVEMVDLGTDRYVIGSGLFPITKYENMILMAKSGADYLATHSLEDSLREFCARNGRFIRGDLFIFVYDTNGICLAYGNDYNLIWRNMMSATDEGGKPFVRLLVNSVQKGSGNLMYQHRGATRLVHVEAVEKDGATYIVGSGFYL